MFLLINIFIYKIILYIKLFFDYLFKNLIFLMDLNIILKCNKIFFSKLNPKSINLIN